MRGFSVDTLDLNFFGISEAIASFLVRGPKGVFLIDPGPDSTLPHLLQELKRCGIDPQEIRDIFLTHVHLDHSGSVGWWVRQGTRIHAHTFAVPHLIDSSKLVASAQRVYGERTDLLWGKVCDLPSHLVSGLQQGQSIDCAGLEIQIQHSPGHARHHVILLIEDSAFTGDITGIRLHAAPHILLPTPPPEFDPDSWKESVRSLRQRNCSRLFFSHFGSIQGTEVVGHHLEEILSLLGLYAQKGKSLWDQQLPRSAALLNLRDWEEDRRAHSPIDSAHDDWYRNILPISLNLDGLLRYGSQWALRKN